MIETLGLVLLTIGLLFLSGYAPTLLLINREMGVPRLLAMPVVGIASNIVCTFLFAAFALKGSVIAWASIALFLALALVVPKSMRLDLAEIREARAPLSICVFAFTIVCWPLVVDGFRRYIAFGNPDAAYNISVYEYIQKNSFNMPPVDSYHPWPGGFRIPFGIGYLMITVAQITGVSVLSLHEVIASCLIFSAPASTFIFVRWALDGSRRTALIAAAFTACSSLVAYNFYLQSIGAVTLIALLPALLAVWSHAAKACNWRLFVLTGILTSGLYYGYYASAPIVAILLSVDAVVRVVRKEISWLPALAALFAIAAIVILTFPDQWRELAIRILAESGSQRLSASLEGSEVLLSFGYTLTENLFPMMWGLSLSHGSASGLLGALVTSLLDVAGAFFLIVLAINTLRSPDTPLTARLQLLAIALVISYFIYKHNGYGVFKFAMWMPAVLFAYVIRSLSEHCGKDRSLIGLRGVILLSLVGFNLGVLLPLSATSLANRSGSLKPMIGYEMSDFADLRSLSRFVGSNESIMVSVPGAVVQRWMFAYLRPLKISVLPALELSPDLQYPSSETLYHGTSDSYLLTWTDNGSDLTSPPAGPVIWRNRKFKLISLKKVNDYSAFGVGWYGFEQLAEPPFDWMKHFRWLRREGEILLINLQPGQRLRLGLVTGYGKDDPERRAEIYCDGHLLDTVTIRGYTNFITSPIPPGGFLTRITIKLPDDAKPIARFPAYFNRWVPKDVRRLNIALSRLDLLTSTDYEKISGARRFDFQKGSPAWDVSFLNGVFPDGWIARKATLPVDLCPQSRELIIEGMSPGLPGLRFPLHLRVEGAREQTAEISKAGEFTVSVPLRGEKVGCRNNLISLTPGQSVIPASVGKNPERRPLAIRLSQVYVR